jgi:VWFA-related protein
VQPPASTQATAQPADSQPASQPATSAATDSADDQPIETIRKRVNEVNVVFTVTDKHGRFVKDLKKDDFKVLDDNKPPTSVVSFRAETDLPLRVGLLVDTSNSVRDRFKFEQESAIEFLAQIIRPKSDLAFVIGFDTVAEVTADFTDNSEESYGSTVNEMLSSIVNKTLESVGKPVAFISKEEKVSIVQLLDEKGVFLIKGAIDYVAKVLCVSRYTVYNYLDEIRVND